jgi:hypothetical protein
VVITAGLLYLLATIDAACAGFRDATGRSGLIRKRAYYKGALLRGALAGQAAVLVALVAAGILLAASDDRGRDLADLEHAGDRLLLVFLPYTIVILLGLLLRQAMPIVDVRSTLSSVIFGPLTLARPFVVVGGIAWAVATSPTRPVIGLAAVVLPMMLSIERVLGLLRRA